MAKQSAPQELVGVAPKLVEVTDEVLFGDVWERPGLAARDRSLVTVSVVPARDRRGHRRPPPGAYTQQTLYTTDAADD
ncbi:hypothetical protein ACFWYS_36060, partial [Streptomyces sp. NPDC059010]